jgi:hypothetical protein
VAGIPSNGNGEKQKEQEPSQLNLVELISDLAGYSPSPCLCLYTRACVVFFDVLCRTRRLSIA